MQTVFRSQTRRRGAWRTCPEQCASFGPVIDPSLGRPMQGCRPSHLGTHSGRCRRASAWQVNGTSEKCYLPFAQIKKLLKVLFEFRGAEPNEERDLAGRTSIRSNAGANYGSNSADERLEIQVRRRRIALVDDSNFVLHQIGGIGYMDLLLQYSKMPASKNTA